MSFYDIFQDSKLIVFDLDGTLIDTPSWIVHYANEAREELGFRRRKMNELIALVGNPPEEFWSDIDDLRQEDSERLKWLFREKMNHHLFTEKSLYPAVQDTLRLLREKGKDMAIATNKPVPNAQLLLEKCGILSFFRGIVGGDICAAKPDPAMLIELSKRFEIANSDIVMIGDRVTDVKCAKNSGAFAVGLMQSIDSKENMVSAGADFIFNSMNELYNLLENHENQI